MWNYCVIAESANGSETDIFRGVLGQVLNHYRTGTSLKVSIGHALLLNFCKFDPKKSCESANCTVIISKLHCKSRFEIITVQFAFSRDFFHLKRRLLYDLLFNKFTKIKQYWIFQQTTDFYFKWI